MIKKFELIKGNKYKLKIDLHGITEFHRHSNRKLNEYLNENKIQNIRIDKDYVYIDIQKSTIKNNE